MAQLFSLPAGHAGLLFARARSGDRGAFSALVEEHQAMVFSIALRFLRDRALAEEVAQEVFLDFYRHQQDVHSSEHLVFWLRQVTSRRCIDQTRRRKWRAAVSLENAPEPEETPDYAARRLVDQLLGELPENARLVMILRYQEDLGPTEIAALLDWPLATVKSHLQRSLAALRERVAATAEKKK